MTETDRPTLRLLTEYFYPEETSTAQLLTQLAVALTDEFDVSVVTGYPNYHEGDTETAAPSNEVHRGVSVQRLRATRFHKERLPLRLLNWLSFTLLTCVHLLRKAEPNDSHLVLSNPPILSFATWIVKRVRGIEYTYLIYDMYPDMPVGLGYISGDALPVRLWERAIRAVYRDADRIVVLGESMRRRLERKMEDDESFDPEKIEVIPNWEDGEFIRPMEKSENDFAAEHGTREKFTLLYSGNVGRYHDIGTAIEAVEILEDRGRTDVQLLVIGEGGRKRKYEQLVEQRGIQNVSFLPFQPMDRLPESLTCGDASLVAIDEEMEGICVSSKLYSSLAAGDPILAVVADGDEVARVVREHDCGAHVRPGASEQVADLLERWADDEDTVRRLGENARRCFEHNYTKDHAIATYTDLFDE